MTRSSTCCQWQTSSSSLGTGRLAASLLLPIRLTSLQLDVAPIMAVSTHLVTGDGVEKEILQRLPAKPHDDMVWNERREPEHEQHLRTPISSYIERIRLVSSTHRGDVVCHVHKFNVHEADLAQHLLVHAVFPHLPCGCEPSVVKLPNEAANFSELHIH